MIAIITARGGSKGLPKKNTRNFLGRPLIAHTIDAAIMCRMVSRVILSTDCAEIAEVGGAHGAEIPFLRPPSLATDTASSRDVVLHALEHINLPRGEGIESFCLLQPTSPLRGTADILKAVEIFHQVRADSVISVCEFDHPVQWAVAVSGDGKIATNALPGLKRRQDMRTYYRPNGAIYVFNTEFFMRSECYTAGRSFAYIMPQERSYDIDSKWDFVAAEAVGRELNQNMEI